MNKLKLTKVQGEILRLLSLQAGDALNQHTIAKRLGVSAPAVMKALPDLRRQGFIVIAQDKESRRKAISLDMDNRRVMQLKRADNLRQIYESGLSDTLEDGFPGATIVLFGSYSRGDDTSTSDIDIAVIGRKEKTLDLQRFEKTLGRKIRINVYESFPSIHKHLRDSICNGIVLAGGIEL